MKCSPWVGRGFACLLIGVLLALGCGDDAAGSERDADGGKTTDDAGGGGVNDGGQAQVDGGQSAWVDSGTLSVTPDPAVALTPSESEPHRVIYWGDFGTAGAPTVGVLDQPSGKVTLLESPVGNDAELVHAAVADNGARVAVSYRPPAPTEPTLVIYDLATLALEQSLGAGQGEYFSLARFSRDGSRLAFAHNETTDTQVYVTELGAAMTLSQLTKPGIATVDAMAWSAAGRLAFAVSLHGGEPGVAALEEQNDAWVGSEVGAPIDALSGMSWAEGERLYFAGPGEDGAYRMQQYDPALGMAGALLGLEALADDNPALRIDDVTASPDGALIAFSADTDGPGKLDLYVLELASGKVARFTDLAAETPAGKLAGIAWRRDSKAIAFSVAWTLPASGSAVTASLFVAGIDGRIRARIDGPELERALGLTHLGFSPDGSRLYWVADAHDEGVGELYGVDPAVPPADLWDAPLVQTPGGSVQAAAACP